MPGGYGMGVPGANVLGAGVRYTNSKKTFSIGLNVEGVWYDNKTPSYFKQYDYAAEPTKCSIFGTNLRVKSTPATSS